MLKSERRRDSRLKPTLRGNQQKRRGNKQCSLPRPVDFMRTRMPFDGNQKSKSVLIVDFDVALLDSNADCVLAVIIANSVAVLLAANQFTAARWHANLDVDTLWLASAATML